MQKSRLTNNWVALIAVLMLAAPIISVGKSDTGQTTAQTTDRSSGDQNDSDADNKSGNQSTPEWRPSQAVKRVSRGHREVSKYPVIVRRIVQAGGIRGNLSATRTLDGQLTSRIYQLAGKAEAQTVASDYKKRLAQNDYQIVFHCRGQKCGPHFMPVSPGVRRAARYFGSAAKKTQYLVAEKTGKASDRYVVFQTGVAKTGKHYAWVGRIKTKPVQIAGVQVSAEKMASDIRDKGRAALYGIYFAFDSATLKPKSQPTLEQIVKLLGQQSKLDLLVVGHTDSRGSFQYNIKLSRQRARAVVDALVKRYDIDRDRLKPWGDGYTAPSATNRSENGRSRNRRVELVPR